MYIGWRMWVVVVWVLGRFVDGERVCWILNGIIEEFGEVFVFFLYVSLWFLVI